MQWALFHAVKDRDFLASDVILPKWVWGSSVLTSKPFPQHLQPTPAMFICLSCTVYRTQLLKQPVIKNMLCKQNRNGGKTACVPLAHCITNQAKATTPRFLSPSPQRGMWFTVRCRCYFEAWRLFPSRFTLSVCDILVDYIDCIAFLAVLNLNQSV